MASQFEVGKIAEVDARSFAVDPVALQLFPSDAPTHHLPVCVRGDGNCLFRAASLLLTGNEESCHKLLRLETAKELTRHNKYYSDLCVERAYTCAQQKHSLSSAALLSQILDDDSYKIFSSCTWQGFTTLEAFAQALKITARNCEKLGSYVSLPEALSLTSVMGVNLKMIYPDTASTSGFRHFLQGLFSPMLGCAASTVHIMWCCASTALLHQPLLRTNHFVPILPSRKQSSPGEEKSSSSSESNSCSENDAVVTTEANRNRLGTVDLNTPKSLQKVSSTQKKTKQQSMFAFVAKKDLTATATSEYLTKTSRVTVSTPASKKASYDAVYDAEKRRRQFVPSWKDRFPWLQLCVEEIGSDGNVRSDFMRCKLCCKHSLYADNRSPFVLGTTKFRIDPIKKHSVSKQHLACVHAEHMSGQQAVDAETTVIGSGILRLHEGERQRYRCLFRTAYAVAKRCKPFVDYEYICKLQILNGVDLGKNYLHEKAAAKFIKYVADEIRLTTARALVEHRYVSVICDGSTDLTVIEQEMVMVRYVELSSCQPVTKLAALVDLKHANADGVYSALQTGLKHVVNDDLPDALNIVCGNFDGAAVMMGARNGVKAKLICDHPCATIVHCVAHKLELAVLDTVKRTCYLDEFERTSKEIIKLYHYSPKRRRELRQVADTLFEDDLKSFSDIKQIRWIVSKERALKAILHNLPSLASHLEHMAVGDGNSNEEKSRAQGLLDNVLSFRFVFWLHIMLDFLSVVTKVSRKFQQDKLTVLEIPDIITGCIDSLSDLIEHGGDYRKSFNLKFNASKNKFGKIQLRGRRMTRESAKTDGIDWDMDATNLFESSIAYLKQRFACFDEEPLKHFKIFNFKLWPYNESELKKFGHNAIKSLLEAFYPALEKASCNINEVPSQWGRLKRCLLPLRTSPLLPVYSDLLKAEYKNPDLSSILHLVDIMFTISPSTAECERQFSGMKLIKSNRRCRLQQATLDNLMRVHCDGPELEQFAPDNVISAWLMRTPGSRHIHGHHTSRKRKFSELDQSDESDESI
ncbi:zinc finger protein 862-like [Corticium candelabrum]|uniref:zinc finger protein 862-like n=1 Tax=Corticium candelabrum TaxID=121492 RepID=UPI002E274587|nr:zinc finger protein 862-like [Corticium candelabrum]